MHLHNACNIFIWTRSPGTRLNCHVTRFKMVLQRIFARSLLFQIFLHLLKKPNVKWVDWTFTKPKGKFFMELKGLVQKWPKWRLWTNFHKTSKYVLSCNVTVAKWIVSCSQHIVLVIWIEFPPKLYQVTLLLARKVKLLKCQEIPIISAGGKKQFCCCPWWMWLKKKI